MRLKGIINYNKYVLGQLQSLLQTLDNSDYTVTIPMLYSSTLGKHTRHILEFYHCFFTGIEHFAINYDLRERNMRLESDIIFAKQTISGLVTQFDNVLLDANLAITSELPDDMGYHHGQTTISRELSYLADHTVHHLALVKIGFSCIKPDANIADNIGIAASTINSRR